MLRKESFLVALTFIRALYPVLEDDSPLKSEMINYHWLVWCPSCKSWYAFKVAQITGKSDTINSVISCFINGYESQYNNNLMFLMINTSALGFWVYARFLWRWTYYTLEHHRHSGSSLLSLKACSGLLMRKYCEPCFALMVISEWLIFEVCYWCLPWSSFYSILSLCTRRSGQDFNKIRLLDWAKLILGEVQSVLLSLNNFNHAMLIPRPKSSSIYMSEDIFLVYPPLDDMVVARRRWSFWSFEAIPCL